MVHAVEKAITNANLGLNPQTEGQVIRLRIPELNEERRKELVKVAHKYAEAARVAVRHVRRDGIDVIKKLEKDHKISKDDHDRFLDRNPEGDRSDDPRHRPDARAQGKGNPDGVSGRRSRLGRTKRCRCQRSHWTGLRISKSPAMSPSSWMATDAGRPRAGCRAERDIAAASRRLRRTVRAAGEIGIDILTIFAFSSENWSRPQSEIRDLLGLLRRFIRNDLAELHQQQRARARHRRARRTGCRCALRCSKRPKR